MKRIILTALLAMSLLAVVERSAKATDVGYGRKFGLGIVIGDPTGLTAKWWIAQTNALDFGLGFWGYGFNNRCFNNGTCDGYGYRGGTFNTDYLWQSNIIRSQAQLDWHVGLGGRAVWVNNCAGDCVGVSARAPIGLDLMFNNPNFLEVFFEIAPSFILVPGFWFEIEGGLGVRFYF
jgi:hypothetical protein